MNEPFTVTETIQVKQGLSFEFMSFREVAHRLKEAVLQGALKANKRYRLKIEEV